MKFKNSLLVVTDMDKSVQFYKKVLGLHVIMDFGANKTLTGGLSLQTAETWKDFTGRSDISFGTNKKTILMRLQRKWKNWTLNISTLLRNIHGDSVWSVSMIRTGILSKSGKI